MDGVLKDLTKLENLTAFNPSDRKSPSKSKSESISDSLDSLLAFLNDAKQRIEAGVASEEYVAGVQKYVEEKKKEIDDRQKEIYSSLARYGKSLDKV